eukprot:6134750-Pyramimonas_sp.AAC.1
MPLTSCGATCLERSWQLGRSQSATTDSGQTRATARRGSTSTTTCGFDVQTSLRNLGSLDPSA